MLGDSGIQEYSMIIVNGDKVEYSHWPGGEIKFNLTKSYKQATVVAYLYSSDDIILLLNVVNALNIEGSSIDVHIPYLPYARQDRVINKGEANSAYVMKVIYGLLRNYNVYFYEPHSAYSAPPHNTSHKLVPLYEIVAEHADIFNNKLLIAPDKGADSRVSALGRWLKQDYVTLLKNRTKHGVASLGVSRNNERLISGNDCIIVDDICDGGRTFLSCAEVLKNAGAKEISLYTVHGIYSYGAIEKLAKEFKNIYCTFLHPNAVTEYNTELGIVEVLGYEFK